MSPSIDPDWLVPDWNVPGVGALMTTRRGGVSASPFESCNLGARTGDSLDAVARNRAQLARAMGATPVYLNQVHGARVVRVCSADAAPGEPVQDADASITTEPGIACTVLVADCMPVLFAAPEGLAVGAAHAGWRGLAAGVLEATLRALCDAASCEPGQVSAWLGACIGPDRFEVGEDVLVAFGAGVNASVARCFVPHAPGKWLAHLPRLARERLAAAGVQRVDGGTWCTVRDASRFFSYRRDRITGRMAASVWIDRAL
jgi:YfiH family protein